jgi:ketosteroid isomerase-like protein
MRNPEIPQVVVAIVTSVILSVSCSRTSANPAPNIGIVRQQLDSVWSGLSRAMKAGDTTQLSAFYAEDLLFAETGASTIQGVAKLRAASTAVFACCRYLESNVYPEVTEVLGSRAFQFGTYRDVIQPTGQTPITLFGRFSAVLDRDSANAWRVARLTVIRDSAVPSIRGSR